MEPKNTFTTKRLRLRPFYPGDKQHFYELNEDPEVLKYTGDSPFQSVEDARRFLEQYDHYEQYGFGRWAVLRKTDNMYLGWCGLKYTPYVDEVDIGFRFFRKYWGHGYATEAAQACLDYAFNVLQLDEVVGRAMNKNKASIRVLKKIGMSFLKSFDFEGHPGSYYHITTIKKAQSWN
jgi:ribosomal-protein-alanine N-acetyltransferase